MSAYATARLERSTSLGAICPRSSGVVAAAYAEPAAVPLAGPAGRIDGAILDALIERVAERVAAVVAARLTSPAECEAGDWLDSRRAAEYLGVHRDTLRKLAAERAIPAEQDGRGCKLFFLRAHLDEWRRTGGRATHLSSVLADAA